MAGQTVVVSVLADTRRFNTGLNGAASQLTAFSNKVSALSRTVTIGVGIAGLAFGKFVSSSVSQASDLQQALGGAGIVFKKQFDVIEQASVNAYKNMGLAQNEYITGANLVGVLLKNTAGIADATLGTETDKLIQRAADLSAAFGGTATEALDAFSSALRGEYNPIEKYGIILNEARVNQEALAMTGKKSAKELTLQEKGLARLSLVYKQSSDFAGRFADENGQYANSLQQFTAKLKNFATAFGQPLLDPLANAIDELSLWFDTFSKSKEFENFQKTMTTFLVDTIKKMPQFITLITKGLTWLMEPENAKMIGNTIAALAAMGPAIRGITAVATGIKTFGGWVLGAVGGLIVFAKWGKDLVGILKRVDSAFELKTALQFPGLFRGNTKAIGDAASAMGKGMPKLTAFIGGFESIAKVAGTVFKTLGKFSIVLTIVFAAIDLIKGFIRGLTEMWDKMMGNAETQEQFKKFWENIKPILEGAWQVLQWLGDAFSWVFEGIGYILGSGIVIFITGIVTTVNALIDSLKIAWDWMVKVFGGGGGTTGSAPASFQTSGYTPSSASGLAMGGVNQTQIVNNNNITMSSLTPNAEAGRAIARSLDQFNRAGGRRALQ